MNKTFTKKIAIVATLVFSICSAATLFSQSETYFRCATDEVMQRAFDLNPALEKAFNLQNEILDAEDKEAFKTNYENQYKALLPVYTIPVVFHVLHVGGTENISDAQIIDAVRILNEDYRKLNADISTVVPSFTAIAADCEIQFVLARKDPNGNCTNGIDRIYSTLTNNADDGSKLNPWPNNKYLNVWVFKSFDPIDLAGVAGYSYLPSGIPSSSVDGVAILSPYVGSIGTGHYSTARVLTHEIGHYLNLKHPWGNGTIGTTCTSTDNVSDTPPTKGHSSCDLTSAVCNPPTIENVQNYMDYAYCDRMFTSGQRTRMRSALTSGTASRNNLWTTSNLTSTGVSTAAVLCASDFQSNSSYSNILCEGDSVIFNDLAWNGNPTSWSWTFPGGIPATSTDSTPVVHYNTAGDYNVSLSVTNASGTVSNSKTNYIHVNHGTAMYANTFYSEGFEGTAIPNADWQVVNTGSLGNTWSQTTTAASTGSKSVRIVNATANDGQIDELISPSIDMTAITGSTSLSFKLAYAQRTTTTIDLFRVYVSTTCGKTWQLRYAASGASIASAGVTTTSFVPTASQWIQKTTTLGGFATATNLYIKFQFTSNGGNNIYLDDINIGGATGIDEFSQNLDFNIFPNPTEGNTTIGFNLIHSGKTEVKVNDVVGREVISVFSGDLTSGQHAFEIGNKTKLSAGVYFVTLVADDKTFTRKLIVK